MRAVVATVLLLGLGAAPAAAQAPTVLSPRLARTWAHPDTTVLVWVVGEPGADLGALAARVRAAGGTVRHLSRFVGAVSARVPGSALRALARLPAVRRIQALGVYYRRPVQTRGPANAPVPGGAPACAVPPCAPASARAAASDTSYGPGAWAMRLLNVPAVQALGDSGAGVRIALLDAGINTAQPYLAGAHVIAQRDYVTDTNPPNGRSHGTATFSLLAANRPGRLVGVAPAADYILATTEYTPTETRVEEDNWVAAVEMAESLSVNIISSSLGYLSFDNGFSYTPSQLNGDVAVTTVAADSAAARGTLVVVAAGNAGPGFRTLDTPADAKGIVAVGATDSLGAVAAFSSRGPTADGRLKPEVVAPGVAVTVAALDSGLVLGSGTSFATPLVAGLAALVQSTRPGRPASELRRGLLDAATLRDSPDSTHGWGVPDALRFLAFPTGVEALAPLDSLASVTPTFSWDAGTPPPGVAPDTFRLQVGTDTGLATLLLDSTVTSSSVTLPVALPPGTRLYWRVTARSALGTSERTPRTGPLIAPPWVTLRTLDAPSGESIRDSQPLFVWHAPPVAAPPGPFTFDLSVYPASEGPENPVIAVRGLTDTTFRPAAPLEKNLPFRWRIVAHLGASDSSVVTSTGTFLVLDQAAPATTILFQNFPNPFPNRALGVMTSCIWFDIATAGEVSLDIYDIRGRLVRRLVPARDVPSRLDAGRYGRPAGNALGTCDPHFAWDGRDEQGAYVRPGVYLYRLSAPGFRDTKRIVFLGAP
jgi:subtilisin family serine protease